VKEMGSRKSVGREPPFREDFSVEVEESPSLKAVTRKRLVKILLPGKHVL
jgi:hypothetical protein